MATSNSLDFITNYRTLAETAFYTNNVEIVSNPTEAYNLSLKNSGTIVTDQKIIKPVEQGLPLDAKVLVFNDGKIVGRTAAARRIHGVDDKDNEEYFLKLLREALYGISIKEKNYFSEAVVGLDKDFSVKAKLLVPKGFENTLLSWLLNFQYINDFYKELYINSKKIDEGDILVVADPEWSHDDFPYGLSFFVPEENVVFILGMRYFGEFKKATLTLAWGIAARNGYTACHGGVKSYDANKVFAFFGLSGSGKSTLTHSVHNNKYLITILHDDAFIINDETKKTVALEPSYFDKTADYKTGSSDNDYILTAQNIGVTLINNKRTLVTEDLRNKNGRAVKSHLWSKNRVNNLDYPVNAIFWLMKDESIPPLMKLENPVFAAAMGASLATKRTSAENIVDGDEKALVFEPFANPFRTYPLARDYEKFKRLFESGVDAYILNTGFFMGQKVEPKHTLGIIESLVDGTIGMKDMTYPIDTKIFIPADFNYDETEWQLLLREQMRKRALFLSGVDSWNELPEEAVAIFEP